jgi:hypothetical protein
VYPTFVQSAVISGKQGGVAQEEVRAPAREVGGHNSHSVAGVSGTGWLFYPPLIAPIGSPRSAI